MSDRHHNGNLERDHYLGIGMAIGLVLFMPFGILMLLVTENPGMLGVGPALGVAVGVAIGEGLYQRARSREK